MAFLESFINPDTRIDAMLKNENNAISDLNKHILLVIVRGIKLCGMQCLLLRGHRDGNTADSFTNQGNFLVIFEHALDLIQLLRNNTWRKV